MQKDHQVLSVHCFNACWTIMEKPDRTPEDVENMLLLAYTSLWHWKQREDCQPIHLSIGYWQVSRAHALAGQGEMARFFGEKCLGVGESSALPAFYIGYAYEALARAETVQHNVHTVKTHLESARERLRDVTDVEEKTMLEADLVEIERRIHSDS